MYIVFVRQYSPIWGRVSICSLFACLSVDVRAHMRHSIEHRGNTDMCLLRYPALDERKKIVKTRYIIHKGGVLLFFLVIFGSSRDGTGGVHLTCAVWRRTLWVSSAIFSSFPFAFFCRAGINRNHHMQKLLLLLLVVCYCIHIYTQSTDTAQLAPLSQAFPPSFDRISLHTVTATAEKRWSLMSNKFISWNESCPRFIARLLTRSKLTCYDMGQTLHVPEGTTRPLFLRPRANGNSTKVKATP